MSTSSPPLTTTSYAILGLLAIKPWTTYELAQQMDRTLSRFWPRARSKLYEEPKKLVAHGLARASIRPVGRRPRTVYAITPAGRRALRRWTAEPGAGPVLEFEQLMQVFFAENGSREDLLAGLARTGAWAAERAAVNEGVARAYLAGTGPFPERLPQLVVVGRFLSDFTTLVGEWAQWASDQVAGWPDDISAAAPDLQALSERSGVHPAR